ncbi:hypothetical protein MHZ92_09960 [Sporosarcina sp. ACRSL]|uniref:hypothetical protein n=1 Tax=Sporosarcina sp. ACRSL TaxID=2918215 RepID=UPI001EF6CE86|nr:hypothetical protein [Sporosarcina sp. ACRSL]MCG7344459.1 hypothetical protein [Sporosarcina sp. ACRSL]
MKKFSVSIGSIVVCGLLLSGCDGESAVDLKAIEAEAKANEITDKFGKNIVEHPEYTSLDNFINDLAKNWEKDSDYRSVYYADEAELTMAKASIAYVNFFQPEIEELGLNEDFYELQLIANDILLKFDLGEDYAEERAKFTNQIDLIQFLVSGKETGAFSKYQTVKEYIWDIGRRWTIEAKTSVDKLEVVNDTLVYGDYFQDEIAEMGLKEDFDKLVALGIELINNADKNEGYGELKDNFRNQVVGIITITEGLGVVNVDEVSRFDDIQSWTSTSAKILSEPIEMDDEKGNEIALRTREVIARFPNHLLSDDYKTEEEKIHSGMFLLASEILHRQRTAKSVKDYDELEAKFEKLKQYVEDVANQYQ